jgi:hypothetical protein
MLLLFKFNDSSDYYLAQAGCPDGRGVLLPEALLVVAANHDVLF